MNKILAIAMLLAVALLIAGCPDQLLPAEHAGGDLAGTESPVSDRNRAEPPQSPQLLAAALVSANRVRSGETVTLKASVSGGIGSDLRYNWEQIEGPGVALSSADAAELGFVAPEVVADSTVSIRVTVTDGRQSTSATAIILVSPSAPLIPSPPAETGQIAAAWKHASQEVLLEVNWLLPDAWLDGIQRGAWGDNGLTIGALRTGEIPSGVHRLLFRMNGDGRSADVAYGVSILNYTYRFEGRLTGQISREIVLEIEGGVARVLFNGWLPAADPSAGAPTGTQTADVLGTWRNADEDVDVDVRLEGPEVAMPVTHEGWARQGMERSTFPAGVPLPSGVHNVGFFLNGSGRAADITFFASFPGFQTRYDERLVGPAYRIIGLDVTAGIARPVYDGWKQAGENGSGGISGVHALDFVAGWRNASDDVRIDLNVWMNGDRLPAREHGWAPQGYQRVFLAPEAPLPDGSYLITIELEGTGRVADIQFDARLLNWTFSRGERRIGGTGRRQISIEVSNGAAREVGNTW